MKWFLISLVAFMLCVFSAPTAYCGDSAARLEDELASRGLIGGAIGDVRADARIPEPAEGASVSEITDFHGPMGWPAPTVDLQLTHRYVAPAPKQSATAR